MHVKSPDKSGAVKKSVLLACEEERVALEGACAEQHYALIGT